MRTTLTLDDDLADELRETARRSGHSFKEIVNAVLRKGLTASDQLLTPPPRFVVTPKACGFRSGVGLLKLNQLVDETAIEDFERTSSGDGRDTAGQRES